MQELIKWYNHREPVVCDPGISSRFLIDLEKPYYYLFILQGGEDHKSSQRLSPRLIEKAFQEGYYFKLYNLRSY